VDRETERLRAAGRTDPLAHAESRPVAAEVDAIERVGQLAARTGCQIHIFHLTSADGLAAVERWRARGVDVTCELSPHHAFLTTGDLQALGSILRVNPPVRPPGHGDALLAALADGRISGIATDHAPHTSAEKLRSDVWQALSGVIGVETSVRLFLTHAVETGRLSLPAFARASSTGLARAWGLYPRKGAIAVGSDADLTIVDLGRAGVIEAASLHGRNNLGPFEGWPTIGAVAATVVRGRVVMRDGELLGDPSGLVIRRTDTDAAGTDAASTA